MNEFDNLFFFPCALALPPPPALDEEAPANYFNLDPSSSPAVMNISLPPPPGINPPPPGETSLSSLTPFSSHTYRSEVADSVLGCSHYAQRLIFNLCQRISSNAVALTWLRIFRILYNLLLNNCRTAILSYYGVNLLNP